MASFGALGPPPGAEGLDAPDVDALLEQTRAKLSAKVSMTGLGLGERESYTEAGAVFVRQGSTVLAKSAEDKLRLARGTHSAAKGAEKAGGLAAILARYPLNLQRAIKEHCLDYMSINTKLRTLESKFKGQRAPTILLMTRDNLKVARRRLKEVSGDAFRELLNFLHSPEASMGFVITEDDTVDQREARIARRKLAKGVAFTGNRPMAQAGHDAASTTGSRALWNQDKMDNRSYYERQQELYGKGRRGSTEHSGSAWDEIFADGDKESSSAAPAASAPPPTIPITGDSGAGTYAMPTEAYLPPPDSSSAASPPVASASPPPPPVVAAASGGYVGGPPLGPPTPGKSRLTSSGSSRRMSFSRRSTGVGSAGSDDIDASASASASVFTKSSEIAKTSQTARSFAVMRGTHSAARAGARAGGVASVMARYPLNLQRALREVCLDILELEVRLHTLEDKWESTRKPGDPEPAVIGATQKEYDSTIKRLFEMASSEDCNILLSAMRNEEVADAFVSTEDDAETEEEARILRRKLNKFFPKGFNHGHTVTVHDAATTRGEAAVWNQKVDDNRTYYQRQRDKYGRARRGSPGMAGSSAWDEVFAEAGTEGAEPAAPAFTDADPYTLAAVAATRAHEAAGELRDTDLDAAIARAKAGDAAALTQFAEDLARGSRR